MSPTIIDPSLLQQAKDALDPSLRAKNPEERRAEWRNANGGELSASEQLEQNRPSLRNEKIAVLADGMVNIYDDSQNYGGDKSNRAYVVVVNDPKTKVMLWHDKVVVRTNDDASSDVGYHAKDVNEGVNSRFTIVTPKDGDTAIDLTRVSTPRGARTVGDGYGQNSPQKYTDVAIEGGNARIKIGDTPNTQNVIVSTDAAGDITLEASPKRIREIRGYNLGAGYTVDAVDFRLYGKEGHSLTVSTPPVLLWGKKAVDSQSLEILSGSKVLDTGGSTGMGSSWRAPLNDLEKMAGDVEKATAAAMKAANTPETGR